MKQFALRKWFDGRKCPRDSYFSLVDQLRVGYRKMIGPEPDPDWGTLAPVLARFLNREGAVYGFLDGQRADFDPDEWDEIVLAAAWLVLQRYEAACAKGKWTPTP